MNITTQNIVDVEILALIAENKVKGWSLLYDKYASCLFGIICKIIDDKNVAEEVFVESFLELKKTNILSNTPYSLCVFLSKYTYTFAKQKLLQKGLPCIHLNTQQNLLLQMMSNESRLIYKQTPSQTL